MDLSNPNSWKPLKEWHPDWNLEWQLIQLKKLAFELINQQTNLRVKLNIEDLTSIYFDVWRDVQLISDVFVNPGGYSDQGEVDLKKELTFSIYTGAEHDEFHGDSFKEAINHIANAQGILKKNI